jgi:dTMP kinase
MAPGTFVTVSGIDGSGKSTLLSALAELARSSMTWPQVVRLRPLAGDRDLVGRVRSIPPPGDGPWPTREEWLAGYFSLRLALTAREEIAPALAEGALVLADRWTVDHEVNQAYFGVRLDDWQPLLDALPVPHMAVWLDVPVDVAQSRVRSRGDEGVGTGDRFLSFASDRFAALMTDRTHVRLDGCKPTEELAWTAFARLLAMARDR